MDDRFFWFPLHSGDFLSKTATLSAQEVGCYILMLVHLTRYERLPQKMNELRRICRGEKPTIIKSALRCMESDSVGFYSKELAAYKKKAANNSLKKSLAGQKGARARWAGKGQQDMELDSWKKP
jgi:uncharacterized protein YdaU (DUF1376 family)